MKRKLGDADRSGKLGLEVRAIPIHTEDKLTYPTCTRLYGTFYWKKAWEILGRRY